MVAFAARDPLASPLGFAESDLGNAARLHAAFFDAMVYVVGKGWGVADASRYSFRAGEVGAMGMAKALPDLVRGEADAAAAAEVSDLDAQKHLEREGRARKPRFNDLAAARKALPGDRRRRWEAWAIKCEFLGRIKPAI